MAYRSSSQADMNATSATSLQVTSPAGTAENDIVILCWSQGGSGSATLTWPSGFTQFTGNASVATPDTKTIRCAWKREDSTPDANYTVSTDTEDLAILIAVSFSGRHLTDPPVENVSTSTANNASVVSMTNAGVTAVNGDDLLYFAAQASASFEIGAYAAPGSFTERQEAACDFYTAGAASTRDNVSAGATGSIAGTWTLTSGTTGYGTYVVRIPAAAGGGSSILRQMMMNH